MFLYGMSLLSGGLQKMAGNRMRNEHLSNIEKASYPYETV